MDAGLAVEEAALKSQPPLDDLIELGDSNVQRFYNQTSIFVTGGTGFLGKQLIEKLVKCCKVKTIYILMRPKKGKNIKERLDKVLEDPLFKKLLNKHPDCTKKLMPVEGDISELGLGITEEVRNVLIKEIEIIFHVAATVAFDHPIGSAILTNVRGTREVIRLSKQCTQLKALVHVSTAYCHATVSRSGSEVLEQFYHSPASPELMIQMAENVEEESLNQMKKGLIDGWPNTYAFTKALAEELIRTEAADLPACIIRPTIVICCRRGPCPGWVDISSVYGPSGLPLGTLTGIIHVLQSRQEIRIDFVPVDYVCNASIVSAVTARKYPLKIYQIGSSCRNYLTWGNLVNILNNTVRETVITDKAMWYCFVIQTTNKWVYLVFQWLLHDIPAFIIDGILVSFRKPPRDKVAKLATQGPLVVDVDAIG